MPHTNTCLSTVKFSENDILKIIRKLDPSKAPGHDKISVHVVKLSDKAVFNTLHMIYTAAVFSTEISNIVPIHEKESKQLVKKYRPISLLPICGKYFNIC